MMNKVFYGHILIMNKLFLLILDNGLMRIYKMSKVPFNYPYLNMICNTIGYVNTLRFMHVMVS